MEQFMLQLGIMSLQACVVIGVVFCVRWIFLKAGVAGKYTCLLWFLPYLCMICPWKVEGDYGFWRQWELPTERMEVFSMKKSYQMWMRVRVFMRHLQKMQVLWKIYREKP